MAIITSRGNTRLLSRLGALVKQQRLVHALSEGGLRAQSRPKMVPESSPDQGSMDMPKWKKLDSRLLGIKPNMISQPSWIVLKILQAEGFEAYLVGGCVRDLILRRMPKDFDVITTANLKQIKKKFHRAQIVGQRFPICRVHVRGTVIEVSSFETVANTTGKKEGKVYQKPPGCDKKDFERWKNSMHRDFTINSLFFDPFANKIYDYVNGIADLRSLKLRTLGSAKLSFEEDCARILRGLRITARLSLSISKETESAMRRLSSSISNISQARLMMELNYMFSYGASEPSLCLLWRFDLLKILLPFHAAYFDEQTEKMETPLSSTMLMKLFSNLDKVVTCDRPSDCNLWVGLLAFHLALVNNPQDALVVLTFASVLYREAWEEGVQFSRDNAEPIINYLPEISCSSEFQLEDDLAREVTQLASLVLDSIVSLTATGSNIDSVSRYPVRPGSGSVFVSKKMAEDVAEIFRVLVNNIESYNHGRKRFEIDYQLLGKSYLREVRFVLGKVILESMGCSIVQGNEVVQEDCLLDESVEENCNKGRKRGLTPDAPEMKQDLAKKRKSITKKGILPEQDIAIDKQDVFETCISPQRELISVLGNMLEKQKGQLPEEKVIEKTCLKKIEKHQHNIPQDKATKQKVKKIKNCSLSEETIKLKSTLEEEEYPATQEVIAEKITEGRQQVTDMEKGSRPQDKATKQKVKKVKKHNTSEHETIKLKSALQKNEFPPSQEVISEKIREDRQLTDKKKVSLCQLSSLFNDEVIQNHKPAAEKEKHSLPRLSSLFK